MVVHSATAKAEVRRTGQELLKVRGAARVVRKKHFPVEDLREELVQIHPRIFSSETQHVLAFHPAHRVHKIVVVLRLGLVGGWRGADLKARTGQHEFVDGGGDIIGGTVDSQV